MVAVTDVDQAWLAWARDVDQAWLAWARDVDQAWLAWARDVPLQVINSGFWFGCTCEFLITFLFLYNCRIGDNRRVLTFSHTVTCWFLRNLTDADNVMNLHFESSLAYIWIRIRINPKILFQILDHFRLTFWLWRSLCSLSVLVL